MRSRRKAPSLLATALAAVLVTGCSPGVLDNGRPDGGADGGCGSGCPAGLICRADRCVDSGDLCVEIQCPSGARCHMGTCIPGDPCEGVVCPNPGDVCQGGDCVSGEADSDGDGFRARDDCDDSDPAVYPGAPEACNGLDDDCDDEIDEGHDADGDGYSWCGYGDPTRADCDDDDRTVFPGATETCNGLDDDCDGEVDELADRACSTVCGAGTERCRSGAWVCDAPTTCDCVAGESQTGSCGLCGRRTRTCLADRTWGAWSACSAEGVCSPGTTATQACGLCGTQSRTCTSSCTWGAWSACSAEGVCSPGTTATQACGLCGRQSRTCTSSCTWGAWSTCSAEGVCSPGDVEASACDRCSRQVCGPDCRWGSCDLVPGNECEWSWGATYRCCGPGYWQYCLPSCIWSTDCDYCGGCGC